jgi:DNA-binding HxlR family transcriptional regulator
MALLDLLGRRWTLRVLWELRRGPLTFAELQRRCDAMSPSVLNQRISELREARILVHTQGGYRLTAEGKKLLESISPLTEWARRWARAVPLAKEKAGEEHRW